MERDNVLETLDTRKEGIETTLRRIDAEIMVLERSRAFSQGQLLEITHVLSYVEELE